MARTKGSKIIFAFAVLSLAMSVGAGVASASTSLSRSNQIAESQGALQATEVAIARTNLPAELERALGDAFGGVWLEPATAQLHVGITSPKGRQRAEAVSAHAGLTASVTETPVSSSWTELTAAQSQWDQRLQDLFEAGRASTSLSPEQNSVKVELGSSVPTTRRAALEQEAKDAAVKILIETVPDQRLTATPLARCAKFVKFKAYCDPTLVSGVSIIGEKEENGEGDCTAGPVVYNKQAVTETLLLTAGHCIVGEGAVGKSWWAFEKVGPPEGKKEIGKALATLNEEAGADVGVVSIALTTWGKEALSPLSPGIAPWSAAAETEPFPVIKEVAPVLNGKTCFSGQRSGVQCGEIVGLNKTIGGWEKAVEVKLEKGSKGGNGDSGAPFFAEAAYKTKSEGYVEGILVGGLNVENEESETIVFQPLGFLLEKLKAQKGQEYELLTTANETRGWSHIFENPNGGKVDLTVTPDGTGTKAHHVFDVPGNGSITCKKLEGHALGVEHKVLMNIEIENPKYTECTFLGQSAEARTNGCDYNLSSEGTIKIECPAGKELEFSAAGCTVKLEAGQNFANGFTYHNVNPSGSNEEVTVEVAIPKIHGASSGIGCLETGAFTTGEYTTGNFIITGEAAGTQTMTPFRWN